MILSPKSSPSEVFSTCIMGGSPLISKSLKGTGSPCPVLDFLAVLSLEHSNEMKSAIKLHNGDRRMVR